MQKSGVASGTRRNLLPSAVSSLVVVILGVLGLSNPTLGSAQSQTQTPVVAAPDYKYEVASIKPSKAASSRWEAPSDDAFTVSGVTLKALIQSAYKVYGDYGLSGVPGWFDTERYDVNAKMDGDAAEAIKKLSNDDRIVVRQQMLQALLAERFGLVLHRETREAQVYTLVIAKNGPKLHEAKPGDTYPNGIKLANGPGGAGVMLMMSGPGGSFTVTAQGIPLSDFLPQLSFNSGRPVLDKTGLTGKYDFTLTYSLDQSPATGTPNGLPLAPMDVTAPSLFTAVQEQLGLKLEAGKGPVEVIVIDHAERPSGN